MVKRLAEPRLEDADTVKSLPKRVFSTAFGFAFEPGRVGDAQPQASATKTTLTIITAELLIPGAGEPIPDAALVIQNAVIAWVGPLDHVPRDYTDAPHRRIVVPYLMPGLWDCHVHFEGFSPTSSAGNVETISGHPAAAGARLAKGCWEALQSGYTSVRDLAGYGCEVSHAIEDGSIIGPHVYSAGACLSQTGGHGDVFELPAGDALLNLGALNPTPGHFGTGLSIIADGVEECRRAVRLQIRRGAQCIKVMASGGVGSRDDDVACAQFSPEELECIVREASRQKRSVAAHVHSKEGIIQSVNAGVTTVEHVSFADEECIRLIKEKGTIYVATRTIIELLMDSKGEGLLPSMWEKLQLVATSNKDAYEAAIKEGLTFALGTDLPPGSFHAKELEYAVKAGMSNLQAIEAATANGPLTIGARAPKTGQLKVGYEADIIGLMMNPVEDVRVLQNSENIRYVWKTGRLFKGPGVGPWGEL